MKTKNYRKLVEAYRTGWIAFGVTVMFHARQFPSILIDFGPWAVEVFPIYTKLVETEFAQEPEQEMSISYQKPKPGI